METPTKYVAYYRVSTKKQGASGLGLEAQREAVHSRIGCQNCIIAEYTEIESGKKNNRAVLLQALEETKRTGATLVVSKMDRLSREMFLIHKLRDTGVKFICLDLPDMTTLSVGIFATIAQHERETISARTKAALAAKKAQGAKLGKPENLNEAARLKGLAVRKENAANNENNRRAAAFAASLRSAGLRWSAIADKLNEAGFKTSKGKAFQAVQVQRLVA